MKEYIQTIDDCDCCPNKNIENGICCTLDKVIHDNETIEGEFPDDCPLDDY